MSHLSRAAALLLALVIAVPAWAQSAQQLNARELNRLTMQQPAGSMQPAAGAAPMAYAPAAVPQAYPHAAAAYPEPVAPGTTAYPQAAYPQAAYPQAGYPQVA